MDNLVAKLSRLKAWQAALILLVVGLAVFFTGLTGQFWDDDYVQIVNNVPVHSITNMKIFFDGGTFYVTKGQLKLSGVYFRPLMTTTFALVYTLFGAHPIYYHIVQLGFYIASAVLLYLIFRYSFSPALALGLSLIFLVHPLDSQVAFAIPSMQDALFFFFGVLALWLLLRFESKRSLALAAFCLFLAILSKETAIAFIVMAVLYLFWFNRERLRLFIGIILIPLGLYILLRLHAIGLNPYENVAPINNLSFLGRMYTSPSILLFDISKLLFPWKLATAYYWTDSTFSIRHVLLPLILDFAVVGMVIYAGVIVRRKATEARYYTFLLFTIWATVGLVLHSQIIALDMTACETWFYFSMAGVLGMVGIFGSTITVKARANHALFITVAVVIGLLGIRTAVRGLDWRNMETLSYKDVSASPDDFVAYNDLGANFSSQKQYTKAMRYIHQSISIYPTYFNYSNLATAKFNTHDYAGAFTAYNKTLNYGQTAPLYEQLAELSLLYGSPGYDDNLFTEAVGRFPHDATILTYLALVEQQYGSNDKAKAYITDAVQNGQVSQSLYGHIMNNESFDLHLDNVNETIHIP